MQQKRWTHLTTIKILLKTRTSLQSKINSNTNGNNYFSYHSFHVFNCCPTTHVRPKELNLKFFDLLKSFPM